MKAKYVKPSVEIISLEVEEDIMTEPHGLNDDPIMGGSEVIGGPPF